MMHQNPSTEILKSDLGDLKKMTAETKKQDINGAESVQMTASSNADKF